MSVEAWLAAAGILVTLGLAGVGAVVTLIGWLLMRMLQAYESRIKRLESHGENVMRKITVHETVLSQRGYLPQIHKYPSPTSEERA